MRVIILFVILVCFTGCKKKNTSHEEVSYPIKAATATLADVPLILNSFGTLSSPNTVNIRSQVSGEILQVPFKEGAFVRQGDLLIAIDPSPFLADLQKAKATVLNAKAQLQYTKLSYESYKQLAAEDFISEVDMANYYKTWQVSEGDLLSGLAQEELAKINLGYTQITAPITGVIGFMGSQAGNIASPQDTQVTLVQVKPLYLLFSLSEQDLYALREAQKRGDVPVSGTFLAKDRPPIQGALFAIDNSVDTSTGTILIKAAFPNDNLEAWPGEFIRLNLLLKMLPDTVVIDKNALQYGQQGPFVFVIDSTMHVSIRNVTIGPSYNNQIAIMEGLKNEETVVTDGQLNLFPGAKVYNA